MAVRLGSSGLVVDDDAAAPGPAVFADTVLRGVGQVMLMNNSYAGLAFVVGLACSSPVSAAAALAGAGVGTAAAAALGADRAQVRAGLFGFNGSLVAVALVALLAPGLLAWGCAAVAAAASSVVMAALSRALGVIRIPALTAPFVFTTLAVVAAAARLGGLASPPAPEAGEAAVGVATLVHGVVNGVAQIFLQGSVVTGAVFAAGLLIASRAACTAALAGSLAGLLVAWSLGASEAALRSGVYGFNGALAAIALGGVFFAAEGVSLAVALAAAVVATGLYAALSMLLLPLGLPALTLPFVLVVWLALLAARRIPRLRAAAR